MVAKSMLGHAMFPTKSTPFHPPLILHHAQTVSFFRISDIFQHIERPTLLTSVSHRHESLPGGSLLWIMMANLDPPVVVRRVCGPICTVAFLSSADL